jgi:hypothetical protein
MQIERWWQASARKRQVSQWVSRLKHSQPSCRSYRKPTAFGESEGQVRKNIEGESFGQFCISLFPNWSVGKYLTL